LHYSQKLIQQKFFSSVILNTELQIKTTLTLLRAQKKKKDEAEVMWHLFQFSETQSQIGSKVKGMYPLLETM